VPLGTTYRFLHTLLWGLPLLGTILKQHGYDVRVFFEIVKPIDWEFVYSSQVVCFQTRACTAHRTFDLIKRIKANNNQVVTVIGGTLPTCLPEEMLRRCDFVGRQEGDETLPDLLNALASERDLRQVPGISYKIDENRYIHTPNRPIAQDIDTVPDLSLVHGWHELHHWKLLLQGKLQTQIVQTSRGCPLNCSFCIAPKMYNPGTYRVRSIESVVKEIKGKIADSGCTRFMLVDNCFGFRRDHTRALLRRILEEGIKFSSCFAMCRLDIYKDPELLKLLKQTGFDPLFIGFESFNDRTLQGYDKHQTAAKINEAIATIKEYDLRITGSFVIGSDEETVDSIRATIDSALRSQIDNISIFPLTMMPGRGPRPVPGNRLIVLDYDFLSGNHVNVFPKQMKPSTLQKEYIRSYHRCCSFRVSLQKIIKGKISTGIDRFMTALANKVIIEDIEKRYLPLLYEVEKGLYDEREQLMEHKLPPQGVIAKDFIIPSAEETPESPGLVDHGPLPVGETIDSTAISDIVQAHSLEMALRKCYSN